MVPKDLEIKVNRINLTSLQINWKQIGRFDRFTISRYIISVSKDDQPYVEHLDATNISKSKQSFLKMFFCLEEFHFSTYFSLISTYIKQPHWSPYTLSHIYQKQSLPQPTKNASRLVSTLLIVFSMFSLVATSDATRLQHLIQLTVLRIEMQISDRLNRI